MKSIILVVVSLLTVTTNVSAQIAELSLESVLATAPGRARADATVIKWNDDYTYETLKEGTNAIVCYDRSDERDRPAFAVQCTSMANLARVAQNRRFRAETGNTQEERAMVAAAEANGTRVAPEYGSPWVSTNGPDQQSARTHTTFAVPGATTESTGLPESGRAGGAWIMGAGTSEAHIMIPG